MAYFPGTLLIAAPLVRTRGYRVAMLVGMLLVSAGMLVMSFGAAACSFGGMVGGHLVIGLGVSTLERSANPYAVNCGPRKGAVLRVLLGQTMAAVGTVVAPPLANKFIFDPNSSSLSPLPNPNVPGTCLLQQVSGAESCDALGTVLSFYRYLSGIVTVIALLMGTVFFFTTWVPEVPVDKSPATTHKKCAVLEASAPLSWSISIVVWCRR